MSKFHRARSAKPKKDAFPYMPSPLPLKAHIRVMQFQYFDNGGGTQGKSQFTLKIEVYCEAKFVITKPFWWRTAALLEPPKVLSWATEQHLAGKHTDEQFGYYERAYKVAEQVMEDETFEFVKLGYIEDRRTKTRYPGQLVMVTKILGGAMRAYVFDGTPDGIMESDPFQVDYHAKPGSGRRLFFGFYDPCKIYEETKAIAEKEAPYRQGREDDVSDLMRTYNPPF